MSEKEAGSVVTSENAADFYNQRMGVAVQEPVAAEAENASEPAEQTEQSAPAEEESAQPTEERKQNPKLEKRFSELTKQREQARADAQREREAREALEKRLADIEARNRPIEQPKEDVKPQPGQFKDAFEYAEALAEWSAENALKNREKADAERKAVEERQQLMTAWNTRLEQAKAELPDFDDMVASSDVVVSDQIRDAILESDAGPKILYHLAENPEVAKKLSGMSVISALREVGKLEARFDKPESKRSEPVVTRTKAPEPISPIRSASAPAAANVGTDGNYHGTFAEWKAARKSGKIR